MVVLTVLILITIYLGSVAATIIRLNQCCVLDGRIKVALMLPFLHFIVLPLLIIIFSKDEGILSRIYLAWHMILIFPVVLAEFAARLTTEYRSKCRHDNADNNNDVKKYKKAYRDVSQEPVFV